MSEGRDTGEFQRDVRETIGGNFNFQIDRAHDGKPEHVDLTSILPYGVADKVEVDHNGNVIGGTTQLGKETFRW